MSQTKISKAASMTMADHAVCVQVLLPCGAMAQAGEPALLVQVGDQIFPVSLEVSGRIVRWLVQPGETLSAASDLAELERAPTFCLAGEAYSAVTETLAGDGRFIDHLVTLRRDREGHQRTLVYVVAIAAFDVEATRHALNETLPPQNQIHHLVPLRAIPRDHDGVPHLDRLAKIAVLDRSHLAELQTNAGNEAGWALVVGENKPARAPRLHRRDFDLDDTATTQPSNTQATPSKERPHAVDAPLSLVGGPRLDERSLPINLTALLNFVTLNHPDQAMIFIAGDGQVDRLSYRELAQRAEKAAAALSRSGYAPGTPVLLQCAERRDFLEALWACFLSGCLPVPVAIAADYAVDNQVNARLEAAWRMLDQAPVLTGTALVEPLQGFAARHNMQGFRTITLDELTAAETDPAWQPHYADPDEPCLLLLTSGSTGRPKCVTHSHKTIIQRQRGTVELLGLDHRDTSLNWLPLDHVAGIVDFHLRDMFVGADQVQVPTAKVLTDPLQWPTLLSRFKVAVSWAPNFAYALVVDHLERQPDHDWDLSCVRHLINAGESIVVRTACRFLSELARFGLSEKAMLPAWGMSETASGVTYAVDFSLKTANPDAAFMDLGRPIAGFALRIVDDAGNLVPEGTVGRFQVRGCAVMTGYYRNAAVTAESFTPDGWFKTGDLAMVRDGRLFLTGREKDVIIIHGLNYYAHEIEAAVEELDGVVPAFTAACAVRGRDGVTDRLAVFFHTPLNDADARNQLCRRIRTHVGKQCALVPEILIPLEPAQIPKTGIGKIQRAALRTAFEAGAFDAEQRRRDLESGNENTLPHWFFTRPWRPHLAATRRPAAQIGPVIVLTDHAASPQSETAAKLTAFLAGQGIETLWLQEGPDDFTQPTRWVAPIGEASGLQRCLTRFEEQHTAAPRRFIDLRAFAGQTTPNSATWFAPRLQLIQKLQSHFADSALEILMVTHGAVLVGESDEHATLEPHQAALAPLVRSAAQEHPRHRYRLVDLSLDAPVVNAARLYSELCAVDAGEEIAWRESVRFAPKWQRTSFVVDNPFRPESGTLILLTGACGGVGKVLARRIRDQFNAKLIVVGRRAGDDAGLQQVLAEIDPDGDNVHYLQCDLADAAAATQLTQAIDEGCRYFGLPLRGVYHLAGLTHDRPLLEESPAALGDLFGAKLHGAVALRQAVEEHACPVILFSSITAALGGRGVGAYAAANRALEAFAQNWHRQVTYPVKCLSFSMWEELGMSAGFKAKAATEARGYHLLSADEGWCALQAAGYAASDVVHIGLNGENAWIYPRRTAVTPIAREQLHLVCTGNLVVEPADPFSVVAPVQQHIVATLPRRDDDSLDHERLATLIGEEDTGYAPPRGPIEQKLAALFAEVLKVTKVGRTDHFFQLGGHSILALQLVQHLRDRLGFDIDTPTFLSAPTVAQLASLLDEDHRIEGGHEDHHTLIQPDPTQRFEPFPLTEIQQAYWIGRSATVELGDVAMHLYLEVDMAAVDHERLEQAWQAVVDRHDMLRAVIDDQGRERVLAEVSPYRIAVIDLSGDEGEREQGLQGLRDELSHQMLPPDQWPTFDLRLAKLDDGRARLFVSVAAVHIDGGSFFLIMKEWGRRYRDAAFAPPVLTLTFRDYVLALENHRLSENYARSYDYWRHKLPELPNAPALPYQNALGSLRNYQVAHRSLRVPADQWRRIKDLGTRFGISRSALALTVYDTVLHRWSRGSTHTLNVTLFNRHNLHPEVNHIAGDFTANVLVATRTFGEDDFESRARRNQDQLWQDLEHRRVGGVTVLRELARLRRQAARALMPVVFTSALDLEMSGATSPHGAVAELGNIHFQTSQTPQVVLDCQWFEDNGDLLVMMDSIDAAFPAGLVDDLFQALQELLTSLDQVGAWKSSPRLVPDAQLARRAKINQTGTPKSSALIHELFEARAKAQPRAVAVISPTRTLTYLQLEHEANLLAERLVKAGVKIGELVAVMMVKEWHTAVATLAVLKAGAAYQPIAPEQPRARRDVLLEEGAVRFVLTQPELGETCSLPAGLTRWTVQAQPETAAAHAAPPRRAKSQDLAYVIFTSGSTGKPKGVAIEHQGAVNTLIDINRRFDLGPKDRVFGISALNFDLSVFDLFGTFAAGAALVLPHHEQLRDPEHWLNLLFQHEVTMWNSVPALVDMLVTHARERGERLPPSLGTVFMSGDWIPVGLPDKIQALAPNAHIVSGGGATEASIWSITYPIHKVDPDWTSIPYGKPMDNQRFHVLDEHLQPAPDWVAGDLYIGGLGLARGYWRDPEKTAASFITHPVSGERLYRTGDQGRYRDDGNIEFLGREDFQVKIQGYRIELGEIESALEQHHDIQQAVVVAVGRDRHSQRLVGHLVPAERAELDRDSVRLWLSDQLPSYMVPAAFMTHYTLPLTPTGKLDRAALREKSEHLEPETVGYQEPRNPLEEQLCDLWCELLDVARVGVFDELLQLGCNSLIAITAVARLRKRYGVDIPPVAVLGDQATVAGLAREIETRRENCETPVAEITVEADPANAHEPFPLNAIQQAYWIGRRGGLELGNVAAYFYLEVDVADIEAERLQQAWQRVIERHPMLRTVFDEDGYQRTLPSVPTYEMPFRDLQRLDHEAVSSELAHVREAMSRQVMNPAKWPLFDLRLSLLSSRRGRLHFGLDLLVADAWSVQILFDDLERAYADPSQALPALPLTFRDYLQAEVKRVEHDAYRRARSFWLKRLDSLPPAPQLPLVKPLADIGEPHFERFHTVLEAKHRDSLNNEAKRRGLSPSGLLLAAFAEILGRWSSSPEFTLNVTTFNRQPIHEAVEHIVGDFTSMNLLAVDNQGTNFGQRAKLLQERLWEDLEHRRFGGLEVMREWSRRQGRAPGAPAPIVFTSLLDSYGQSGKFVPLGGEVVYATSQTPQVWLDHQVREQDGRLYLTWDVVTELLPTGLADDMFAAYRHLLIDLAENPPAWEVPFLHLLPEWQQSLGREVNQTTMEFTPRCLHQLFFEHAHNQPERPALITAAGSISYGALGAVAQQFGQQLVDHGVKAGHPVAIVMHKSPQQIAAVLAVHDAGGAYLPVDAGLPQQRRDFIIHNGGARVVLTTEDLVDDLNLPDTVTVVCLPTTMPETGEVQAPVLRQTPYDPAYIIYTSGSTGNPKGVAVDHIATYNTLLDINTRFQLGADDRVFGLSSLSFDLSVFDIFGPFSVGAALVLPDSDGLRSPDHWFDLCRDHGVTFWNSVPALMEMLVIYCEGHDHLLPESLRLVLMSGDWIPLDLPGRIRTLSPYIRLWSGGGATEAAVWSVLYPIDEVAATWKSIPYGKPMQNQTCHILDERLEACPVWVAGDLFIGGTGLARCYWNDPQKTNAAFFLHPRTGERLYRTGDLGRYLPDGNIEFLGRADFQVKVQGHRIELGEIETVLLQSDNVQAAVCGALGEAGGPKRLVAWLVCDDPAAFDRDACEQHLAQRLPDYMIPAAWVPLDRLPLTANGKVDRKALPMPDFKRNDTDQRDNQPHNPLEFKLIESWSDILAVPHEELSLSTSFFRFGGNSLLAIRMLNQLHKSSGVDIPLREFFDQPTIGALARLVGERQSRVQTEVPALPTLRQDPDKQHQPFPLNDIQHAYWMGRHGAMELGNVAAHFYFELDLTTDDPNRIEAAWRKVIARHDMLRAVIDDEGMQRVLPLETLPPFTIEVDDYRGIEAGEQRFHLETTRERLSHQVLDTHQWPLFEIRLSRCDDHQVRLHFSFDLLIADAWSARLVFQEFTRFYHHPDDTPAPLQLRFRDYVVGMAGLAETELYRRSAAYWSARLADLPAAPDLPLATDPATIRSPRFERRAGTLNPQQWQRLQRLAGRLGVTPTGLVLAAYAEVLGCWSQNPAFCINVTTFNRLPLHDEIEQLVGDFTSLTLLAVDQNGADPDGEAQPFGVRARRLQQQLWQDLDHRHYSGIQVIRDLARRAGRSPGALMPVVFTSRLFGGEESQALLPANLDGSPAEVVYAVSQTPQVWLDKQIFVENGTLAWTWDTVAELFMPGVVDDMFASFQQLLGQMADDPHIGDAPPASLLPEATRDQLKEINHTTTELPTGLLHDGFVAMWRATPDALAVVDGEQRWTYDDLAKRAFQVAAWLQEHQAQPEELVVVCMEKGCYQAAATLGVSLAGAAYLPMDPRWPLERRQRIHDRAQTRLILTTTTWEDRLSWPDDSTNLRVDWLDPVTAPDQPPSCPTTPQQLAYVIFTSGSTGEPKGVAIEHRGAVNTLADINQRFTVGADDAVLALSQLHFDLSVYDLFGILAAGATVVYPPDSEHPDPAAWLDLVQRQQVTIWNSVPALAALLLTYSENNNVPLPAHLRLVMLSGDWIALDTAPRLRRQLPDLTVISMGGATEGSIWSILYPIGELPEDAVSVPYGKAMANQSMWVLDRRRRPRPHWVPGDIYIGGIGVAREYYGAPELTRNAFFSDADGNRLYRTGDLGRLLPDGNIEFLGRIDHQVKVGGYRIELGEIEACLLRHPEVVEAVVTAPWVDEKSGPGGTRRLVAYIVRHPEQRDCELDLEQYRNFVAHDLPTYMVPQFFVQLDHLPLTPNGKLDRKALPHPHAGRGDRVADPGRGPLEERIAELWREVLDVDQVARDDAFFDLGGNSLLALSLLTALRRYLHVPLTLQHLFDNLTVAKLATVVAEMRARGETLEQTDNLPTLVANSADRTKPFPLTPVQQAYWIGRLQGLAGGNIAAHAYYELERADFDLTGFEAAFNRMIQRHEALRLVIDAHGEQQILADPGPYTVVCDDLRQVDEAAVGAALWQTRERMSHQVRDTTVWPIFEVRASLLPSGRTRLHLSFDLLIADAWSSRILFRDLALAMQERDHELPPLACSFRDYVLAQNQMRSHERFQRARDYWLRRLDHLPPGPSLPVARLPRPGDTPRFRRFQAHLDETTWRLLTERAHAVNLTPSGLLLAAFCEVLGGWSSEPRFTLNLTTFNRLAMHPDVNDLMGDFTSLTLLAVNTDFSGGDQRFQERARRIQEQLWRDLDHREMNGVEVLREIVRRSGGGVAPRAPIVFTSRLFGGDQSEDDRRRRDTFGEVVYSVSQTPQVWLDHQVVEEDGNLSWTWDVVDGLFHEGVVEDMFDAYNQLLKRLAADDADWSADTGRFLPGAAMPLVPVPSFPQDLLVQSKFFEQAGANPKAVALRSGSLTVTYKQLARTAHHIADVLERNQVDVGGVIAVYLDAPWMQIAAVLGVLEAGAAFTIIDAHLPDRCAAALLQHAGAAAVISLPHLTARLSIETESVVPALIFDPDWRHQDSQRMNAGPASADSPACILFEAPFAVPPRAVRLDHGVLCHAVTTLNQLLEISPEDRLAAVCPFGQGAALFDIFGVLSVGGSLWLPENHRVIDSDTLLTALADERISLWRSPIDRLNALFNHIDAHRQQTPDTALSHSLRRIILCDSLVTADDLERIRAHAPQAQVTLFQGHAGGVPWVACFLPEPGVTYDGPLPHGFALPGKQMVVLNSRLQPCPLYVTGDLYLGAMAPLPSFPSESTDALLTHPETGQLLLRTGQRGFVTDNGLVQVDPHSHTDLQHAGYRVALDDVASVFTNHSRIAETLIRHERNSAGDALLTAYLVPATEPLDAESYRCRVPRLIDLAEDEPAPWQPAIPKVVESWSRELLGQVLAGLRLIQPEGLAVPKYRYPSGGGLYPVQVFLVVANDQITGLTPGIYQFHPGLFKLAYVAGEVPTGAPALSVHFVGKLDAVLPLYPDWGLDFCFLEAGYMNRLLAEDCSLLGISCHPVDAALGAPIGQLLGWDDNLLWVHGVALSAATGFSDAPMQPAQPPATALAPHLRDRDWHAAAVSDPMARLGFKMEQRGLPEDFDEATALPLNPIPVDTITERRFAGRRSARSFMRRPLKAAQFGSWLACLRRPAVDEDDRVSAPMFRFLVELKNDAVEGLGAGLYEYLPETHQLHHLTTRALSPRSAHGPINRPIYDSAAFTLLFLADQRGAYAEWNLIDAGDLGQRLMGEGMRYHIGLCPLGGMDCDSLAELAPFEAGLSCVHLFLGGPVPEAPVDLRAALAEQQRITQQMASEMQAEQAVQGEPNRPRRLSAAELDLNEEALQFYLSERLPAFAMPHAMVWVNRLPENGFNAETPQDTATSGEPQVGGTPRDALEQQIAETAAAIFERDHIGTRDNFFELGANSLQLVQLQGKLQAKLEREVKVTDIFANPTVASLAAALRGHDQGQVAADEARDRARKRKQARTTRKRR